MCKFRVYGIKTSDKKHPNEWFGRSSAGCVFKNAADPTFFMSAFLQVRRLICTQYLSPLRYSSVTIIAILYI